MKKRWLIGWFDVLLGFWIAIRSSIAEGWISAAVLGYGTTLFACGVLTRLFVSRPSALGGVLLVRAGLYAIAAGSLAALVWQEPLTRAEIVSSVLALVFLAFNSTLSLWLHRQLRKPASASDA